MAGIKWTIEENKYLWELVNDGLTFIGVASRMKNRTYEAIRIQASKLKIKSNYDSSQRDEETRKKISASLKGINLDEWDGFKESMNALIRKSVAYKKWRKAVFERDDYTCQKCGKKNCYLNAHHIATFAENENKRLDIFNGITLCINCHKEEHFGSAIVWYRTAN